MTATTMPGSVLSAAFVAGQERGQMVLDLTHDTNLS